MLKPMKSRIITASLFLILLGCTGTDPLLGPAKINSVKAYYCASATTGPCFTRGAAIPTDSLPPKTDSFQVWAFYNGWITTTWRVVYGTDSTEVQKFAQDSAYVWLNLNGAAAGTYTLRIFIQGTDGFLTQDSVKWSFR